MHFIGTLLACTFAGEEMKQLVNKLVMVKYLQILFVRSRAAAAQAIHDGMGA